MKSKLWALALLLTCVTYGADTPFVEARLKFISMTTPLMGVGLQHGKKPEGLMIPTDLFSNEILYRGPARLELYQLSADKPVIPASPTPPEKKSTFRLPTRGTKARESTIDYIPSNQPPLAWIDLPTNQGKLNLILLVTPGQGNGIIALSDPPGIFPVGTGRFLNSCAFPIKIKSLGIDQTIPPGGSRVLNPGVKDNTYYDLQIWAEAKPLDRLIFSSRVFYIASVRKLFLVSPTPGNESSVQVRDIEDRPPQVKALGLTKTPPPGVK